VRCKGIAKYLWIECSGISNVPLQRFCTELGIDGFVLESMDVYDMLRDVEVRLGVTLVQNHEEKIKTTHDRGAHLEIGAQGLLTVVSPTDGIRGSQNRSSGVQCCVNACFGDRDSLLFHCFVNCNLVRYVHLVELVDGANPVVRKHECTSFNGKIARFLISDHGSSQTSSGRSFPGSVNCSRKERANISESTSVELRGSDILYSLKEL